MSESPVNSASMPPLDGRTPACDAAAALLESRLREVSRLLRKASGKAGRKPRCVHQLRVSTRRAAAALRVFGPLFEAEAAESAQKRLKKIRRRAAAARKCDALRAVLEAMTGELDRAERRAAERVLETLSDRRRIARRELRELLERWGPKGMERWRGAVVGSCTPAAADPGAECSLSDLAPVALGALIDTLREQGLGVRSVDSMHRLRLAGKRVRYAVEALSPAFDEEAVADASARLATLQERLGEVNDLSELLVEVNALKGDWEAKAAGGCPRAAKRAAGAAALAKRLGDRRDASQQDFIGWWEGGERSALLSSLGALARPSRGGAGSAELSPRVVVRAIEPTRVLNGAGA